MATKKVPGSSQWQTGRKGASPETLALVYDATNDQYYIASGEAADAYLVLDSDDDQYTVDTARGTVMARIALAGVATARILG